VVNSFIKQQIEKGFSMYVYDFKFSDLSTIAYNHLLNHPDYKVKPKFYVINFDDPRRTPLQSHTPGFHGGYYGRLRERVHHHAQPQ